MSLISRSPTRVAGAILNSGDINTGEQNLTLGGGQSATFWLAQNSGSIVVSPGSVIAGDNVLLVSGAGRLKDVFLINGASGQGNASGKYNSIQLYDTATVASGNTAVSLGAKILGSVPASSGPVIPTILSYDVPFNSGLCVGFLSGAAPMVVTWTPEAQPQLANPG